MSSEALIEPLGHGERVRGLFAAARAERMPHALLFSGPEGIGKFRAGLWFAAGLLCVSGPGEPCGTCVACKQVAARSHPDLFVLDVVSEGAERLRIHRFVTRSSERVPSEDRDKLPVDRFLSLRAARGGWRVVVVRAMERAVVEAQNAILKMLEEPAADVVWVLETSRARDLLPTIRSRTVPVPFEALAAADVSAILASKGLDAESAALVARWSRGSVGQALELAQRGAPAVRALVWEVLRGAPPVAAARAAFGLEGQFAGNTPRAQARDRARNALDIALAVLADVLRRDAGCAAAELAHGDLDPSELQGLAATRQLLLPGVLTELADARTDVDLNVAPEAAVERGFLALGSLAHVEPASRTRTGRALC